LRLRICRSICALDLIYKSYIRFVHDEVEGEGQHLLRDAARPRDARGGGALPRPQQERHAGEPGAQGVLARVPRRHRPHPSRPRRKGGEMRYLVLLLGVFAGSSWAQVKIGELNSYKVFPAFLEPYKKGYELALEEINAAGGLLGRKLEIVSRDDGGTPGDAVRVAEELLSRERATVLMGTFASNVGLAVANLANQRKVLFLAAEPLTDKIVWENGNRYTFRLRPSTYMQTAMLIPQAAKLGKKRWAIVYPNYEY